MKIYYKADAILDTERQKWFHPLAVLSILTLMWFIYT
jgi:hypothetical protein